ncbi:hypothetical protein CAOG_00823 [Capsaspora owczarzaki ATCC 30864]|uniref:CHCH domain-containing protein n=1 Tax=Capsaspora owczarzaki (strain ATCC 30864) TaxID=595528 RepID=A0A0D2WJ72_CAPO3|nr:hypothetical protein CAOG_00823 [Capsaspora owczarzaki ATCC 30864]KJE89328.1 hypothetical protein CAOG_000823 [Capsaspora owczarzaki ATCC 30864]|eukprot:XP_004365694.1 hypothetical protein CAOG_00823 [Capsaspora owczarzaki ATCC 30864]
MLAPSGPALAKFRHISIATRQIPTAKLRESLMDRSDLCDGAMQKLMVCWKQNNHLDKPCSQLLAEFQTCINELAVPKAEARSAAQFFLRHQKM